MDVQIEASWKQALKDEFDKPYFTALVDYLRQEKLAGKTIYPPGNLIFNAFAQTPLNNVKVVILGQDPYHSPGQAHGLSFSVPDGVKPPPSLLNIFREIESDLGIPAPATGNLEPWAKQGVMLLNASLTVEGGAANSHSEIGWQIFTDAVIAHISAARPNVVFMLWGRFAQNKQSLVDAGKHLILKSVHPSPLSAYNGFFGCKHFSKANQWLEAKGLPAVDWRLEPQNQ